MHCLNVITSSACQHLWLSENVHLCVRTLSANNGKGSMEQNSSYKVHKVLQSLTKSTSRESRLTSSKPARWSDDAYTQLCFTDSMETVRFKNNETGFRILSVFYWMSKKEKSVKGWGFDSTHFVCKISSVAANADARYENCEVSIEKFLNSYHQVWPKNLGGVVDSTHFVHGDVVPLLYRRRWRHPESSFTHLHRPCLCRHYKI